MTITEVSQKYDISQDTLRYYERIGLIPRVPIEILIEYVGLFQQGDTTIEARRELFVEQRKLLNKRMEDMKKTLERLDYKIASYEPVVIEKEKELRRSED